MNRELVNMIEKQLTAVWKKPSWTVTVQQALQGVSAAEAAWTPPGAGNTIWQTVNHMNYYNKRTLNQITGKNNTYNADSNEATFGQPGDPHDEAGWAQTVEQTILVGNAILSEINKVSMDSELDSSLKEQLAKWLLHDVFHTGQIVLIRKQQGSWPAQRVFE